MSPKAMRAARVRSSASCSCPAMMLAIESPRAAGEKFRYRTLPISMVTAIVSPRAGPGVGQNDGADHLPAGGSEGQCPLSLCAGDGPADFEADGRDVRQDHERQ